MVLMRYLVSERKFGMQNSDEMEHETRLAYSVTEVANITGLGRTTVYKLIGEGKLQSIKIGRRRLVGATQVRSLLNGKC